MNQPTITKHGKHGLMKFDSLAQVIDFNESGTDHRSKGMSDNTKFYGVENMPDAYTLARAGLPANGLKALSFADANRESYDVVTPQYVTRFDVSGAYVDMGRYVTGEPECMVEYELVETPSKQAIIPLVVSVSHNCTITAKSIRERGEAIVALIRAIEMSGSQTDVWTDFHIRGHASGVTARMAVRLKAPGDPFDVGAFMYALTHPSYLRALGFNTVHSMPAGIAENIGLNSSYGFPITNASRMEDYPEGAIFIDSLTSNNDPTGVAMRVLRDLKLTRS